MYGSVFFGIAIVFIAYVTLSRYLLNFSDSTSSVDIWTWIGLYMGEGPLNFNSYEWYIKSSTNGYSTMPLIMSLYTGHYVSVSDVWNLSSKLGIPGNIFYTYVGAIFKDYGKYGTLIYLFFFSSFVWIYYKKLSNKASFSRIFVLMLWAKILVVGPTFFTYATTDDQINLVVSILFLIYIETLSIPNSQIPKVSPINV